MQVLDEILPAATLRVGPGQTFTTLGAAITAAHEGDTLLVHAGTYTDDFALQGARITLKAVGGMVVVESRHGSHG